MCVILYAKQKELLKDGILEAAWEANPDGAGAAIVKGDWFYIRKGFMKLEWLKKWLEGVDPKEEIILHFRLATHGGVSPVLTHPFPLTRNLRKLLALELETKEIIVHNGIFRYEHIREWLSDTAEVAKFLATHEKNKVPEKIRNGSRVIIGRNGKLTFQGTWYDYKGLKVSNLNFTYKPYWKSWTWDEWKLRPEEIEAAYWYGAKVIKIRKKPKDLFTYPIVFQNDEVVIRQKSKLILYASDFTNYYKIRFYRIQDRKEYLEELKEFYGKEIKG